MSLPTMSRQRPLTADSGRILVEEQVAGFLCRGRQLRPRDRELVVAVKDFAYATGKEIFDRSYRFDVPGVSPLVYLGYPDGASPTADELRELRKQGKTSFAILAEARPDGEPLVHAKQLAIEEVVRLGLGLCDTMIGWIERRGSASVGLRPETVYVAGEHGNRFYAGATPRVCALIGGGNDAFPSAYYGAPLAASSLEIDREDAAFVVALVLWFAATREDAYRNLQYIEHPRAPFAGRPELGEVLSAALSLDDRTSVQQLRDGLARLAQTWSVEPPPFPPPDLA
jgi:hypothetical protein